MAGRHFSASNELRVEPQHSTLASAASGSESDLVFNDSNVLLAGSKQMSHLQNDCGPYLTGLLFCTVPATMDFTVLMCKDTLALKDCKDTSIEGGVYCTGSTLGAHHWWIQWMKLYVQICTKCRCTDDILVRSYNIALFMACTDKSLAILLLTLEPSLKSTPIDPSVTELIKNSLLVVGQDARHLSNSWVYGCHKWLAQSKTSAKPDTYQAHSLGLQPKKPWREKVPESETRTAEWISQVTASNYHILAQQIGVT